MGAPLLVSPERTADPLAIAVREFASGTSPMSVKRSADALD